MLIFKINEANVDKILINFIINYTPLGLGLDLLNNCILNFLN